MIFSFQPTRHGTSRTILFSILILAAALLQTSCSDSDDEPPKPEFSPIPFIEFEQVEINLGDRLDTISITFNYQDGDTNLGLEPNVEATDTIFQELYYITYSQDTVSSVSEQVIKFGHPNQPEFNPWDWKVIYGDEGPTDTLRVFYNENFYNLLVELYVESPEGKFEIYEFREIAAPFGLSARFPPITDQPLSYSGSPFEIIPESICNGKLTYNIFGGFSIVFERGKEKLKFKLFIKDRALNKSNVIETPEILFE